MGAFTPAQLQDRLDTIAKMRWLLMLQTGTSDYANEASSLAKGAATMSADIEALGDAGISADTQPAAHYLENNVASLVLGAFDSALTGMIAGLNANLGLDLDGQIADNILNHSGNRMSGHVADLLRALGSPVTPDSYWPYEGYKFGRFAISGADTGTYTRIQDVADATQIKSGDYLYGACLLKAVAETSVTSCAITVTGLDEDGNVATFTGTLAGVAGTEVNLVNAAPTLKAFYVTSIAIVGGAAAESFLIQVKPDRVVAF